jgi:tetratricopeptide (TPR) repeat protein
MRRLLLAVVAWSAVFLAWPAYADDQAACRSGAGDARIAACSRLIQGGRLRGNDLASILVSRSAEFHRQNQHDAALADVNAAIKLDPRRVGAHYGRGRIHAAKRMVEEAIADYSSAIRLDPRHRAAYLNRGMLYAERSDYDRAIADFSECIKIDPTIGNGYYERARMYARKNDHDRSIADYTAAIRINPNNAHSFNQRGLSHAEKGDFDRAIADYSEAIRLGPRLAAAYSNRGRALGIKGEHDRALTDLDEAVRLAPNVAVPYRHRASIHEKKGAVDKALADYRQALGIDPRNQVAMEGVRRLEAGGGTAAGAPPAAATQQSAASAGSDAAWPAERPSASAQSGGRVALVIGNGAYAHAAKLSNPANDATDIAAALRKLGFDVVVGRDLDKRGIEDKVREFGRKLDQAGVAVFFYAGHGMQVGGKNYLVPTDAKLERAGDLTLDTVDVGQVLAQMESEQRVNLVFLDACRDNPLARTFARSLGTRSTAVGSGLASIQSAIGTMIAYATQPDNVALDGSGRNSPFTAALVKHLATPGLDIGSVMRRVRTDVVQVTRGKQVPWDHSSLMGDVVLAQ